MTLSDGTTGTTHHPSAQAGFQVPWTELLLGPGPDARPDYTPATWPVPVPLLELHPPGPPAELPLFTPGAEAVGAPGIPAAPARPAVTRVSQLRLPRGPFADRAEAQRLVERIRTPLLACHRIAFLGSPAPGEGPAGLAVALGALLAGHRCHQAVVLDLAPPHPDAAAPTPPHALGDLFTAAPLPDAFRHVGGRLTLLTVRPDGPWPGVGDAGYRQALTGLSGHYPVVLSDATGAPEDARQAAVALADQVVIRADASVAGARTASDLLDRLAAEGRGELARGGVVVFAPARSGVPGTDGRAVAGRHLVAHFRTRCRGVVVLPRRRTRARAAAVLELAALTGDAMADR